MSTVTKYDPVQFSYDGSRSLGQMRVDDDGDWVRLVDYEDLEAELATAEARREEAESNADEYIRETQELRKQIDRSLDLTWLDRSGARSGVQSCLEVALDHASRTYGANSEEHKWIEDILNAAR